MAFAIWRLIIIFGEDFDIPVHTTSLFLDFVQFQSLVTRLKNFPRVANFTHDINQINLYIYLFNFDPHISSYIDIIEFRTSRDKYLAMGT